MPCAALLLPSHHPFVSYLFVTEWISAMYPPGNCTTTASRSSVLYGGTRTSTPLAFALVSVSVRFVTSYPVVSLPYGYGRRPSVTSAVNLPNFDLILSRR